MKKLLMLLFCLAMCDAYAQSPMVFTGYDLNKLAGENSNPRNFKSVNGKFVFTANTDTTGIELWISDGTQAGTQILMDIYPGSSSSDPSYFAELGGKVYFTASSPVYGNELWVTDGTITGTKMVKDIAAGVGNANPKELTVYNGKLYFQALDNTATYSYELWVTDGTGAGTVMVKDIRPGSAGSNPSGFTLYNGKLYFNANDGTNGTELWVTDGTAAGTVLVKDINPGTNNSNPRYFFASGTNLYFSAITTTTAYELWKSDGTSAGTQLIKDIRPGNVNGYLGDEMVSYNGKVYFAANDGTNGKELWVTDGTAAGTQMLKDISSGANGDPKFFQVYNNRLYFRANDATYGTELWSTDGTAAGTTLFADINPTNKDSNPAYLTIYKNFMYFTAQQPVTTFSVQLWKTDGSLAGTQMIAPAGATYSSPCASTNIFFINPADSALYFPAEYTATGNELWSITDTIRFRCEAPTNLGVKHVTANNALVVWDTAAEVSGYEYYVLPHPATQPASATATISRAIIVSNLNSSTTYDVCVRSRCVSGGFSTWACDSFRTATGTGIPTESIDNAVRIYPNPSNGTFNVSLNNGFDEHTMITVYDMTGRLVLSKQMNTANETISMSHAAKGIYTIRIVTDNAVVNKRIVIE